MLNFLQQADSHNKWIYNHTYCKIKIVNKYKTISILQKIFNIDIANVIENKLKQYENVIFIDPVKQMESHLFEHKGPTMYMDHSFCGKIYNSTKFKIDAKNWPKRVADLNFKMKFFACDKFDQNCWICINDNLTRMVLHSDYYCNYGIFLFDLASKTKYKRVWNLNVKVPLLLDENGIYLYDYSYIPLNFNNSSQLECQGFTEIPRKFLEQYEIEFLN